MSKIKFFWEEIIYGGHLQAIGSSGIVLVSSLIIFNNFLVSFLLLAYTLTYPLYLYNRIKEISFDEETNEKRTEHLQKYKSKYWLILFLYFAVSLILVLFSENKWKVFLFSFFLSLWGFLYTFYFKRATSKIPLFKNLYVSSYFAVISFLPLFYNRPKSLKLLFYFSLFIFLEAILMQIILDIKDIESDRRIGLITFPIIFGRKRSLRILYFLSLFVPLVFFIIFWKSALIYLCLIFLIDVFSLYLIEKNSYSGYIIEGAKFAFLLIFFLFKV